jgi:uncharacterized DUF497 family protein
MRRPKQFRWSDANIDHLLEHGIEPEEAELVVNTAQRPYPNRRDRLKWLVWGRGFGGRLLQVIFVYDDDGETGYVIHARPLTEREKKRYRRRKR